MFYHLFFSHISGIPGTKGDYGEPGGCGYCPPAVPGTQGDRGSPGYRGRSGVSIQKEKFVLFFIYVYVDFLQLNGAPGYRGEKGDVGLSGTPGPDGLPGPSVNNSMFQISRKIIYSVETFHRDFLVEMVMQVYQDVKVNLVN